MHRAIALLIWLVLNDCLGSTYYVRKDGDNSNSGLSNNAAGAWLSIGMASTNMSSGDTVRVQSGTYQERIYVTTTGASNSWINYMGEGSVICRGFALTDVDYIRIIGFEIVHSNTTYSRGITLGGTSCSYIEILDNTIHHTYMNAIHGSVGAATAYITIRGNYIHDIGIVPNVNTNPVAALANSAGAVMPHHWLVEYNHIERTGDFIDIFGTNTIVRNNYLHDFDDADFGNSGTHSDMFQPGSDGQQDYCRHKLYERNMCGDSIGLHSHFSLFNDSASYGDTNILLRGNVAYNYGGSIGGADGMDKVCYYNNTVYRACLDSPGGTVFLWYNYGSDYSLSGLCANTIIYDMGQASEALKVQVGGNQADFIANLGYDAGTEASYVSTNDPLFVDPSSPNRNFHLQNSSPAIDAGTNLVWVTSAVNSGTSFDVNDGQRLNDGWGIAEGDIITVGGTSTRISSISGNTVTVTNSVTWTNTMPVYWGVDTTPDIGAYPYRTNWTITATYTASGNNYTVTPNDAGLIRMVIFYENGFPKTPKYDPPYNYTSGGGTVTAKVYPLYADTNNYYAATRAALGSMNVSGNVRVGRIVGP